MPSLDNKIKSTFKYTLGRLFISLPLFVFMQPITHSAIAQVSEVGVSIGMLNYTGDLHETYRLKNSTTGYNVFYRYNFNEAFSARVTGLYGRLEGIDNAKYDAVSGARGLSFSSKVTEVSISAEYYFFDIVKMSRKKRFSPYIYAGVGMFYFSKPAKSINSYSNIQPVVPVGLGFKANLTAVWSVTIETSMRMTVFDYLDGISEGDVAVKDLNYGNPFDNDWYYYSGFSVCYTIYKIKCPKMPPR